MAPQRDLVALLKQTTAVPLDQNKMVLKSFFIDVDEEQRQRASSAVITEHVLELLHEYQGNDESKSLVFD